MADASLIIRVLADTSSAHASFSDLSGKIAAALGVGAAGGAAVAVTQTAVDYQSAMAKIQTATNSLDFAPGTSKYADAKAQIMKFTTELATSFEDVGAVYNQGKRFVDEFGNRLPTDKVDEYTDTVLRLSKVSSDAMDPTRVGQRLDVFEKLYNKENFKETGSAVSALSGIHNLGEDPVWQAAIGIAQMGAGMGVTQAQALGMANYLVDVGSASGGGGSAATGGSIGRLLLRMDTSADQILDPVEKAGASRKAREASEHLDDLHTSLREAEAKHAEMYGQHGLKTQYKRHPSEVMAADDRIARLHREIADSQADIATAGASGPGRGKINLAEMAKTAGQTAEAYATLFKENPAEALLAFTRGLHELPETQRGAAETRAGISTNVRDVKTINLLADRPDVVERMIAMAQGQLDQPTDLASRSQIVLDTTKAKEQDVVNAARDVMAGVGEPARAKLDEGLGGILNTIRTSGFAPLEESLKNTASHLDVVNTALSTLGPIFTVLGPALGVALPGILKGMFGSGAGTAAAAAGAASTAGAGPLSSLGGLGFLAAGLNVAGAGAAGALGKGLAADAIDAVIGGALPGRMGADWANEHFRTSAEAGANPAGVQIGDIHIQAGYSLEDVLGAVKAQITAAWNAAHQGAPVSGGAMGGAYATGSAPH